MKKLIIKSNQRKKETKGWVTIYDCFNSKYLLNGSHKTGKINCSLKTIELKPNMGFVPHEHKNINYLIVPLKGSLIQQNKKGKIRVTRDEVYLMKTGSGVFHFEYNDSSMEILDCLIFEVLPQTTSTDNPCLKKFPYKPNEQGLKSIDQIYSYLDILISNCNLSKKKNARFIRKLSTSLTLIYVIQGKATINENTLSKGDTIAIFQKTDLFIQALSDFRCFIFEIPI